MREITKKEELSDWLDENYYFEDGFILKIKEEYSNNKLNVSFRFRNIIETSWIGGEPEKYKEFEVLAENVSLWTKDKDTLYAEGTCIEGIDKLDCGDGIGFSTYVPGLIEIKCEKLIIEEPEIINGIRKPWISDWEIFLKIKTKEIPKPTEWIKLIENKELKVCWRVYGGEKKESKLVPYPDYTGYFIQEESKILIDGSGVFFKFITKRNNQIEICLEKRGFKEDRIIQSLFKGLISKYEFSVSSGNCSFNGKEWIKYIFGDELPERYRL